MTTWTVVLGAALCTYLLRASGLVIVAGRSLPGWMTRHAALVAPAALGALVASAAVHNRHSLAVAVATGSAFVAARRFGSPFAALVVGFPALWVVQLIVS